MLQMTGSRPYIMIVDDEEAIVHMLASYFTARKYQVQTAHNGYSALEKLQQQPVDVVISDLKMPGMDGLELSQHIKSRYPETEIIILTAYASLESTIEALRIQNIFDYQLKPLNFMEEISHSVDKAWDYIQIHRQNRNLLQDLQYLNANLEQKVQQQTQELKQAYQELKTLDQLKSEFLANISHELQSPITPLEGYLSMFLEGDYGTLDSEQRDAMDMMQICVQRLKKQIDNILYLVMLGKEKLQILNENFFFPDIIVNLEKNFYNALKEKNIRMNVLLDTQQTQVDGDIQQVYRIMNILIDNAIKFSYPNTAIQIRCNTVTGATWKVRRTYSLEPHQIRYDYLPAQLSPDSLYLEISVQDRGEGIRSDQLPLICNSFYQADGSSTRERGGIGLGLSIARKLLASHQSALYIESQPEIGTMMSFLLPVNQALQSLETTRKGYL